MAVVSEAAVDGRTLRRERNLTAAVDAMLDLMSEGHPQPTAQEVAERSGLSIRSIFRLFDDMESLRVAAVARQTERIAPLIVAIEPKGSVPARVTALVSSRARLYETIAPVRRSAMRVATSSPTIADGLARVERTLRRQLQGAFPGSFDDEARLDAAEVATSFDTWDRLRTRQGLSRARAERAVTLLLEGLLTERRPGG